MKIKYIICIGFLSLVISCNSNQKESVGLSASEGENSMPPPPPPPVKPTISFVPPNVESDELIKEEGEISETNSDQLISENEKNSTNIQSKIIKDGSISIKTKDINSSKKRIDELVKTMNSYYESEFLDNNDQVISYTLKIRIPNENFEKLIFNLENGSEEIKSKNIQARDVTEEYVDIETRLANKKAYLSRYKDLLAKATSVKDIIAIEENIRVLQEEIESKVGRLKYLNNQVSFSTLDINLYKEIEFEYKPIQQDKFTERLKTALSNGWLSIVDAILWLISIWPIFAFITLLYYGLKYIFKRKQ